ncbi:hypothetical protein [Klebsiella pneumoniae]|uniref:hypothetical protein n=1 Tax=Klebsiella pneumoniae TaxID=573 RepID=UPI0007D6D866
MGRDELEEDRAAFFAGEVGGTLFSLISIGIVIGRDAIVDALVAERRTVGNINHKGLLREAMRRS